MSELTQAQLVAEAEKVNAERTPGPWRYEQPRITLRVRTPDGIFIMEGGTVRQKRDAAFIAFCGTHMTTLLSLLASEGERVKELEAKDSIVAFVELADECATLEADRDRLAAQWEALKEWAGKPDTSVDVGAHGIPEVKRIIRELEAQR